MHLWEANITKADFSSPGLYRCFCLVKFETSQLKKKNTFGKKNEEKRYPTTNGGMQNGSSVEMLTHCVHVFACLVSIFTLSQWITTKFLPRSSAGSILRVRCWLGRGSNSDTRWKKIFAKKERKGKVLFNELWTVGQSEDFYGPWNKKKGGRRRGGKGYPKNILQQPSSSHEVEGSSFTGQFWTQKKKHFFFHFLGSNREVLRILKQQEEKKGKNSLVCNPTPTPFSFQHTNFASSSSSSSSSSSKSSNPLGKIKCRRRKLKGRRKEREVFLNSVAKKKGFFWNPVFGSLFYAF